MIFDKIENAGAYANICPGINRVLAEARKITAEGYTPGRVELDGDALFMNVCAYDTESPEDALMEAHRQYLDVMYMVEGEETIYVKSTDELTNVTQEYNPEIEALLATLDADATPIRLTTGHFVVLFPQDAHAPACDTEKRNAVKKIIGKVRI